MTPENEIARTPAVPPDEPAPAGATAAPARAAALPCALRRLAAILAYAAVAVPAAILLPGRIDTVRNLHSVGGADSAAYALQARSLAQGRGLRVPYVTNYMYVYPPRDDDRQDDHWPPLLSFAQALAFRICGIRANVPAMTTVVIGTLLLPLCLCALVHAATNRAWLGPPAALPLLWSDEIFRTARTGMADQLLAAVLCLFLAGLFFSRRHRAWLLLSGVTLALAWYGKGSQILLAGFLVPAAALLLGFRALLRREFLGAVLLALVLLFPRLHYNARRFGNPLHSTQTHVSAYYGLTDQDSMYFLWGFYSIYWERDLPRPSDRFRFPYLMSRGVRRNTERMARAYLVDLGSEDSSDWAPFGAAPAQLAGAMNESHRIRPLREVFAGLKGGVAPVSAWPRPAVTLFRLAGAAWGLLAMVLAPFVWIGLRWRRRSTASGLGSDILVSGLLAACAAAQALFLVLMWEVSPRLTYPAVIPAGALGWCLLGLLLGLAGRGLRRLLRRSPPAWLGPAFAALFSLGVGTTAALRTGALHARQLAALGPLPEEPTYPPTKLLAERIAQTWPENAVLLCNQRKAIQWFAPESYRSCGLPYAPPADLLAVARYYGVTHIVQDWPYWRVSDYGGLLRMLRQNPRVFEPVVRSPYPVYRIHWDRVPEDWITPLDQLKPSWNPIADLQAWERNLRESSQREAPPPRRARPRP